MEKDSNEIFDSIIMLRFGKTKVAKEEFHGVKKPVKCLDVNLDIPIS